MIEKVAHWLYGDLCAMIEYSDGSKYWIAESTRTMEYPDGQMVTKEVHYYGVNDYKDHCPETSNHVEWKEMPPEMVPTLRERTKNADYWKVVDYHKSQSVNNMD